MKTKTKTAAVDAKCVDESSMRRAPYVHRRPGSDRYQFALPAPPDLAHHFPSQWAVRKSLGTSELREANKKACLWAAEWTLKFEQLRRTDNPQQHSALAAHLDSLPTVALTPDLIAEVTTFHQSRALESDEAARMAGLSGEEFDRQSFALEIEAARLGQAYARGDTGPVDNMVPQWLAAMGLKVAQDDPLGPLLARELLKARLRTVKARLGRQEGDLIDTPPEPAAPALRALQVATGGTQAAKLPPGEKPASTLTMRDVFDLWSVKKPKTPMVKTVNDARAEVDLFERVVGNKPLQTVTRADGVRIRDAILATGVSARTAGDRLDTLIRLMRFEIKNLGRLTVNPWYGLKVEGSEIRDRARHPFKPAHLQTIFSQPIFQAYAIPTTQESAGLDAVYWLPILGAYTGARITELAQLLVQDLFAEDGVWYIHIRVTYPDWQRLKGHHQGVTDGPSTRCIPLHLELVRLCFPQYVQAMKAAGHERIFPMAAVSNENGAGDGPSRWFSEFKVGLGFGPVHTFHSFRHTVETNLKRLKEHPYHINALTGHAQQGGDADTSYTHLEPHDLIGTVALISHPSIDLPKVWPPIGWKAPAVKTGVLKAGHGRLPSANIGR